MFESAGPQIMRAPMTTPGAPQFSPPPGWAGAPFPPRPSLWSRRGNVFIAGGAAVGAILGLIGVMLPMFTLRFDYEEMFRAAFADDPEFLDDAIEMGLLDDVKGVRLQVDFSWFNTLVGSSPATALVPLAFAATFVLAGALLLRPELTRRLCGLIAAAAAVALVAGIYVAISPPIMQASDLEFDVSDELEPLLQSQQQQSQAGIELGLGAGLIVTVAALAVLLILGGVGYFAASRRAAP